MLRQLTTRAAVRLGLYSAVAVFRGEDRANTLLSSSPFRLHRVLKMGLSLVHSILPLIVIILSMSSSSLEDDDMVNLPRIVQYQLLSMYSGRFIGVTGDGCVHAMGDIRDPRTKFIPRFTHDGRVAFESYCFNGQYIVIDNMTRIRLEIPSNGSELFEQNSPFPGASAYKSSAFDEAECYLSFDSFGNAYNENLCLLGMGHMGMLIRYIESMTDTQCDHTQLKTTKLEL